MSKHSFTKAQSLVYEAQVVFFNEVRVLLYTSSRSANDFLQSANDSSRATASRNKRFTKQALNDNTQTTKQRQTETQRTTQDARTKKIEN